MMPRFDQKNCEVCGVTKPVEDFGRHASNTIERMCRACRTLQKVKYRTGLRGYLSALIASARGNAKKRDVLFELSVNDALGLWEKQQGRCAISNVFMTFHRDGDGLHDFNVSLDRIQPGASYTVVNVRLVCVRVNIMRHTLNDSEFFWWAKTIASHWERENKNAEY